MSYEVVYSRQARKDAKKLNKSGLKEQTVALIEIVKKDPFADPPRFEALRGVLKGCYSRRINIQHRLVYEVFEERRIVHILRMKLSGI